MVDDFFQWVSKFYGPTAEAVVILSFYFTFLFLSAIIVAFALFYWPGALLIFTVPFLYTFIQYLANISKMED
jgi:fatty acid desaturase